MKTEQKQGILREEQEGRVAAGNIEKRGTVRQSSSREYKEKGRTREHSSSREYKEKEQRDIAAAGNIKKMGEQEDIAAGNIKNREEKRTEQQ